MVRERARNLRPKRRAVIKLGEVAKLVDDDIVAKLLRQKRNFVIKIQIPPCRTAPPPRFGVANKNFVVRVAVEPIVMSQPGMHVPPHRLAMLFVMVSPPAPHGVSITTVYL